MCVRFHLCIIWSLVAWGWMQRCSAGTADGLFQTAHHSVDRFHGSAGGSAEGLAEENYGGSNFGSKVGCFVRELGDGCAARTRHGVAGHAVSPNIDNVEVPRHLKLADVEKSWDRSSDPPQAARERLYGAGREEKTAAD